VLVTQTDCRSLRRLSAIPAGRPGSRQRADHPDRGAGDQDMRMIAPSISRPAPWLRITAIFRPLSFTSMISRHEVDARHQHDQGDGS